MDGPLGVWARVELENGDPIWISVAQTGVLVKRSKMGLMGAKLFEVSNVYEAARTGMLLDAAISNYETPPEMTNLVLKAFTQTAMNCSTSAEVAIKLNEALREAKAKGSLS